LIVVDASAVIEVLLQTASSTQIGLRMSAAGETLHAPHLLDVEIAQTLRRFVRMNQISSDRGAEALTDLADIAIHRHSHFPLLPQIWVLRHNFSAYDAAYLALAEALSAPLLTCDRALMSARGIRVEVF
jgi:predicted nucleic acid-binding protein